MDKHNEKLNSTQKQNIDCRMEGFDKVLKAPNTVIRNSKFAELPYGFKRYLTCPKCGNRVEIESISEKEAVYICTNCNKSIRISV